MVPAGLERFCHAFLLVTVAVTYSGNSAQPISSHLCSFLAQFTAVLLPVTLLDVIVIVGVVGTVGVVDNLTCKL